jgi:hypothetical protein
MKRFRWRRIRPTNTDFEPQPPITEERQRVDPAIAEGVARNPCHAWFPPSHTGQFIRWPEEF